MMTEDSVQAVRQWLAAGSLVEEGVFNSSRPLLLAYGQTILTKVFFIPESVYTGYEVDDDWCLSVLQSYQTDRDAPFPWSVGKITDYKDDHYLDYAVVCLMILA